MPSLQRQRRATIVDVASHAQVSTTAVSKVIRNAYGVSPAMRDRVKASVEELGYRPHAARAMRERTFTIGVLLGGHEQLRFRGDQAADQQVAPDGAQRAHEAEHYPIGGGLRVLDIDEELVEVAAGLPPHHLFDQRVLRGESPVDRDP